jgi:hypothetical protein
MAVAFKKSNYEVEVMRDDEVIVITIPASQLFDPNDTVLNKLGQEQLKPFLRMLKKTDAVQLVGSNEFGMRILPGGKQHSGMIARLQQVAHYFRSFRHEESVLLPSLLHFQRTDEFNLVLANHFLKFFCKDRKNFVPLQQNAVQIYLLSFGSSLVMRLFRDKICP